MQLTWQVSDRQGPPAADLSAPGLVASWGFWPDQAAAQAARDLSPGKRHGAAGKASPVQTDTFGWALRLNGVDASVDCAADPAFTPADALTVEAWVRWQGPGPHPEDASKESPSACIVGNRGPNAGYMLMVDRSGRAAFNINGFGQKHMDMVHSSRRLDRDAWAHVVGTYDAAGGTLAVFVNGTRSHKQTDKRLQPTPSALAIGAQCAKSRYYAFKGEIAQVRLYARVLPQKEIAANHEKLQSERAKTFVAANTHALQVNGSKWVDVSRVTDPQRGAEPSRIGPGDTPGTLTLAVDDGVEHDWTRGIWITPADGRYLVADTEEFWRWNAPTFTLAPGRHVLRVRARGPFADLDALCVRRSLEGRVAVTLLPEPRGAHQQVPLPNYHGVFYHDEPVRLTLQAASTDAVPQDLRVEYVVQNFMGEQVATGRQAASLAPGKSWEQPMELALNEFGIFEAKVVVDSPDGRLVKRSWFLRLPKLEHPRLLLRRDAMDEIRARIEHYPRLFARYKAWLRQQCEQPGFLRESLLDKYPCKAYKHEASKWRVLACQLSAMFLGPDTSDFFAAKAAPLIKGGYRDSGGVGQYVHNCFPSAPVCLADLAALDSPEARDRITKQFSGSLGNTSNLAESLLALSEPLTPQMRAVLDRQMMWVLNVDRYFAVHAGKRGGNWWTSERTGCCCPLHGVARAFLFYRQAFGLDRVFERPAMGGLFTHHAYVHPRFDARGYFPDFLAGGEGRGSAVMRDVVPSLAKQPVEAAQRDWKGWIEQLQAPGLPAGQVDKLFAAPLGDLVPWFLALGWFDPASPQVRWEELPPTVLFDGEGEVVMHSDMGPDLTRVHFQCGVRDIVYRGQPSHFEVMNAGQILIGTGALGNDHVNPTPSWGNVVAVGNDCLDWWRCNIGHRRGMDQHLVMNRHSSATETYVPRDTQLCGYREPGGAGSGYTLGFHTHTKHPFVREGGIVAYETWPEFDYVAGDATNAWSPSDVSYAYRQLVFVPFGRGEPKAANGPDVLIVYDRVGINGRDKDVRWLAATGASLLIEGDTFLVENRPAVLRGRVLLPSPARLKSANPYQGFAWRFQQRVLEVRPDRAGDEVEFLVVMCIGKGAPPSLDGVKPVNSDGHAGVEVRLGQKRILAMFRRGDPVGGRIQIHGVPRPIDRAFAAEVDDDYAHWQPYPLWKAWTTEPRFSFICPRP